MKLTAIALALVAFANSAAFAKTVQGCEVIDMGGYFNKADPTCVFDHQPGDGNPPPPSILAPIGN